MAIATSNMSDISSTATFKGGCHCGHIKYECTVKPDFKSPDIKIYRCNCTFCQKLSTTNLHIAGTEGGAEGFKLMSPASKAEVADYQAGPKAIHRYFCATCGTHVWMEGFDEFQGRILPVLVVNLATADQPQEGLELSQVKIRYWDGLKDNFAAGTRDKPWPGGMV